MGRCQSPAPKRLKNREKWPWRPFFRDCDLRPAPWMMYPPSRRRSPIAQLVEHSTVNRIVAGSSPARGASFFNSLDGIRPRKRGRISFWDNESDNNDIHSLESFSLAKFP